MGKSIGVVAEFLDAVNRRDVTALGKCLTSDAAYHFSVPKEPVSGREAIIATFARILADADRVHWEVRGSGAAEASIYVERIDHFWFGGRQVSIECVGVFEIAGGLISEVRDYVDMETWRRRREQVAT